MEHLHSNASMLVLAGSETTAATLTGITYLLLSNPSCLDKLRAEILSAFKSEDEICFKTTKSLPYLQACIEEGLRRYPAVAIGFPRITPSGGWSIANQYIPEGVSRSCRVVPICTSRCLHYPTDYRIMLALRYESFSQ